MEVTMVDEAGRAAFFEKTASVREKWAEKVGAELVKKAEAAIQASR